MEAAHAFGFFPHQVTGTFYLQPEPARMPDNAPAYLTACLVANFFVK
jgi:hypothetical protein